MLIWQGLPSRGLFVFSLSLSNVSNLIKKNFDLICILKFLLLIFFSTHENNINLNYTVHLGFPCNSAGKESACKAWDLGSIPGSEWSTGEGTGYPLQYSWPFLVAQQVKNPTSMQETWIQETWIQSLHWEDPLEKGMATHSSILAWRIPWIIQSMRSQRLRHNWSAFTVQCNIQFIYKCWISYLCVFYRREEKGNWGTMSSLAFKYFL